MTTGAMAAGAAAVALAAALAQLHAPMATGSALAAGAAEPVSRIEALIAAVLRTAFGRHAVAGVVTWSAVALLASPLKAAAVGLLAAGASWGRERRAAGARRRGGEAAVPALARALADALRGGISVRGAIAIAADDRSIPVVLRDALQREATGLEAGAPLVATLTRLSVDGGPAMRLLCGSIALHLEAGGALASELDRIAVDGEAGRKVEEERVAATAQARATVRVVAALPLLAMAGAQLANPGFLATLTASPIALALLVVGLMLEIVAVVVARAIVGTSP